MSHAGTVIGIPWLEVIWVKRRQGIEVWAQPYRRPMPIRRQVPGETVLVEFSILR